MSIKFLIFVLGTFLLVQCTHGYVAGKKIDDSSSEETNKVDEKEGVAAAAVVLTALSELVSLIDSTYTSMRTAFQPLKANFDATCKCELTEKLGKMKELFEKTDKLSEDDLQGKAVFVQEMTKIFGDDLENTKDPAADASELEKKFSKAKKALETEGVKNLTTFSDHIVASIETYWNSLSVERKAEEKELYDTLIKIKNGTSVNSSEEKH